MHTFRLVYENRAAQRAVELRRRIRISHSGMGSNRPNRHQPGDCSNGLLASPLYGDVPMLYHVPGHVERRSVIENDRFPRGDGMTVGPDPSSIRNVA